MKAFNKAVYRFCYKHPKFGIKNLMLYIIGGNALIYLLFSMSQPAMVVKLYDYLSFNPYLILRGQVWRLVSFILIPSYYSIGDLLWMAISLYFYYFIGSTLEKMWGPGRFTVYYITGVVLNVLFGFLIWALAGFENAAVGLTASYLNLSMFFSFAVLFPDVRVLLLFFIPVKIKWLAILDAVLFIYETAVLPFPMNFLPLVAIANFFLFCGSELIGGIRRGMNIAKHSRQFRSDAPDAAPHAAPKVRPIHEAKTYRHKCEVCGKTDTEYPQLEFRYCSRCAGYHCFCLDHINDHVHFTE